MTDRGRPAARRLRVVLAAMAAALGVLLGLAGPVAAAPVVANGWPVAAPAGPVMTGPGGGPLVQGLLPDGIDSQFGIAAYRLDGRRRWAKLLTGNCGNCASSLPARRWPDGTFGPFGPMDAARALDARGRWRRACLGAVRSDGSCVDRPHPGSALVATQGAHELWRFEQEGLSTSADYFLDRPPVYVDHSGTIYTRFEVPPPEGDSGAQAWSSFIAVLAPDGTLRRRIDIAGRLTAPLPSGVLVVTSTDLVSLGPAGVRRWRYPISRDDSVATVVDRARARVYVRHGDARPVLDALDLRTGRRVWRTSNRARMFSVGPSGRVYVVDSAAVRALSVAGKLVWRFRVTRPSGVAELPSRRVAVSSDPGYDDALLYLLAPGRSARRPSAPQLRLRTRRIATGCGLGRTPCSMALGMGTILSLRLPRAMEVTVTLRDRSGRLARFPNTRTFEAPAGRSDRRLLFGGAARSGPHRIVVELRRRGFSRTVGYPVELVAR